MRRQTTLLRIRSNQLCRGIKITDGCGCVLYASNSTQTTYDVRVATRACYRITAYAAQSDQTYTLFYNGGCYQTCFAVNVRFDDTETVNVRVTLRDSVYNLPVASAILQFSPINNKS